MTDQLAGDHRIVVALDGSEAARHGLRWSIAEAKRLGATVEAVHVWRRPRSLPLPGVAAVPEEELESAADTLLRNELAKLHEDVPDDVTIERRVVEGPPALRLTEAGADADLLVVGARGSGLAASLGLGSVSQQCAHLSTVPVVIVRDDLRTRVARDRVAVGVDGSEESSRALAWAAAHARRHGVPLHVLMAWSPAHPLPEGEARAAEQRFDQSAAEEVLGGLLAEHAADLDGVEVDATALSAHPGPAIIEAAAAADLVVVGSRGLGGFKRLALGSVSHQVAHRAACPVVIVPHRRPDDVAV